MRLLLSRSNTLVRLVVTAYLLWICVDALKYTQRRSRSQQCEDRRYRSRESSWLTDNHNYNHRSIYHDISTADTTHQQHKQNHVSIVSTGATRILTAHALTEEANGNSENRPLLLDSSINRGSAIPIVTPVEGNSKLAVTKEGIELLHAMRDKDTGGDALVAPVVVIGPYRSGKSFLLNQLLGVDCAHGFGVGHKRHTQTRGLWLWSEPIRKKVQSENYVEGGGVDKESTVHVLFIDTEGFESSRKAAYDDRIFILSTVIASVLIYNLPEAVREADVEKLSFAAELAEEFFGRTQTQPDGPAAGGGGGGGGGNGFEAPSLLWLVQRDFLQGQSVQENVEHALKPLPNPDSDPEILQSNKVRDALKAMASKVTAVGLTQPHINRTMLCDLDDTALDAIYIEQRESLRNKVLSLASPKHLRGNAGNTMRSKDLAKLLQETVDSLNESKIPNAGNLVEAFNKDLLAESLESYQSQMDSLKLPLSSKELEEKAEKLYIQIKNRFEEQRYGSHSATSKIAEHSAKTLDEKIAKAKENYITKNKLRSFEVCTRASDLCLQRFESLQEMSLPSEHRLKQSYEECSSQFNSTCVGPSFTDSSQRLNKAWASSYGQFRGYYNRKLSSSLLLISFIGALLTRFILKRGELELVMWAAFLFLLYPKIYFAEQTLYDSKVWQYVTMVWEVLIFNPLVDVDHWWRPLVLWPCILYLCYIMRKYLRKKGAAILPRHNRPVPD